MGLGLVNAGETTTAGRLLEIARARLAAAGIEPAQREARLLLNLALALAPNDYVAADRAIDPAAATRFGALLARRADREPYSRIAGKREFWSRDFCLSPDTLDPRPDSETLIEAALARISDRNAPLAVIDFGTGTGALLLALLGELPNAEGLGIDCLPGAVRTAHANAVAQGLAARCRFGVGSWGEGLSEPADVIVANPPYIPSGDLDGLAPEISRWDPRAALDGGKDGLDAYRELAPHLARLLKKDGFAVCEIGAGQGPAVAAIMATVSLDIVAKQCDLGGVERSLVFERTKNLGKS